jgi:hypothetical protein
LMRSPERMPRNGRKNVSRCPLSTKFPACPGSPVPEIRPIPRRKVRLSLPSSTIADNPRRDLEAAHEAARRPRRRTPRRCGEHARAVGAERLPQATVFHRLVVACSQIYAGAESAEQHSGAPEGNLHAAQNGQYAHGYLLPPRFTAARRPLMHRADRYFAKGRGVTEPAYRAGLALAIHCRTRPIRT